MRLKACTVLKYTRLIEPLSIKRLLQKCSLWAQQNLFKKISPEASGGTILGFFSQQRAEL